MFSFPYLTSMNKITLFMLFFYYLVVTKFTSYLTSLHLLTLDTTPSLFYSPSSLCRYLRMQIESSVIEDQCPLCCKGGILRTCPIKGNGVQENLKRKEWCLKGMLGIIIFLPISIPTLRPLLFTLHCSILHRSLPLSQTCSILSISQVIS